MENSDKLTSAERSPASDSDRDFQTFFELSGIANVIADGQTGRFLRVNSTFCELTGYSSAELLKLSARDLTHPEDAASDEVGWQASIQRGESHFEIEKRYVRKDGGIVWVRVTSTFVRDHCGTPVHAIGVIRDISDRRLAIADLENAQRELENRVQERTAELAKANAALSRENAERTQTSQQLLEVNTTLSALIDACPLAILTLDCDYRVTVWNRSAEKLLGWKKEEVLGRIIPNPPVTPQIVEQFLRAVEQNESMHLDTHWEAKDGRLQDLSVWYAPLYESPEKLTGHLGLLMDISEKRFLEKALLDESEREQRRIGQALHDHLAPHLLGAAFAAKALEGDLKREGSASAAKLDDLARLLNDAVGQVRDISRGLHPVELDSAGLMSSLQELAERLNSTLPCQFACDQTVLISNSQVALHAYRIAQEAVALALHAQGGEKITLSLTESETRVTLEICKLGMPPNAERSRLDVTSQKIMEYRAKAIGGQLHVQNALHSDLRFTCSFPNPKE